MKIYCHEKDARQFSSDNHFGCTLIDEQNGAKKEFGMGISCYFWNEYGKPGVHNFQEGFYVLEGSGTAKIGNEEFKIIPGSAFIAADGVPHSFKKDADVEYVKILYSHGSV